MSQRKNARQLNGILLLDKPLEISSNGILQRVRWLFNAAKAGHTGALDPLASGLLPVCFGEATKFSQFLLDTDKTYQVEATLGIRTDTSDAAGEVISEKPVHCTEETLREAMESFRGAQLQIPTMFSALKYQGQPLYKYARQGIDVPREARPITIFRFDLLEYTGNKARFVVHCSKGTYIRTLIDDLGEKLGCGAHVSALHRVQVGPFEAKQMVTVAEIEQLAEQQDLAQLDALLLPVDAGLVTVPALTLDELQLQKLIHGQPAATDLPDHAVIKLYRPDGQFTGIGTISQGTLISRRLMNTGSL
ncbi:tRNA pseudouridine(55) synthase TruB [Chromatiaceae bacterium AAb-1]|nr:tRNA pseudouridine(55) synthase TruB [Chromatiaceae bacterium AAb-1]